MATIGDLEGVVNPSGFEVSVGNLSVRLIDANVSGSMLSMTAILARNGENVPFNNPWNIINPPAQTGGGDANASAVLTEMVQRSGFFTNA